MNNDDPKLPLVLIWIFASAAITTLLGAWCLIIWRML